MVLLSQRSMWNVKLHKPYFIQDMMEMGELLQGCKTDVEINFATAFWEEMRGEKQISQGKVVTVNEIRDDESLAQDCSCCGGQERGPLWLRIANIFTSLYVPLQMLGRTTDQACLLDGTPRWNCIIF